MAGIVVILKYLRNRTSEEYLINCEKKFEDSNSEMLDREIELSPMERREAKKDGTDSKLSIKFKKEKETVV